jgi:nucleoid-associated protein YgaU
MSFVSAAVDIAVDLGLGGPKLEKAYLAILPPTGPVGGALGAIAGGGAAGGIVGGAVGAIAGAVAGALGGGSQGQLTFRFNPKEYTVKKTANWKRKPARGAKQAAMPEFTGANPRELSLEIFLDASDSQSGSVVADLELLFSCCAPTSQTLGQNKPSPPFVLFGWGSTMSFTAVMKSVSAKYTMFRADGTPTRAVCTVTLEELPNETPRQNPTSGGIAARRTHTVVAGDSLPLIAYREYGDPGLWRALANANAIDDPLRLRSGLRLLIPPADEATAYTST